LIDEQNLTKILKKFNDQILELENKMDRWRNEANNTITELRNQIQNNSVAYLNHYNELRELLHEMILDDPMNDKIEHYLQKLGGEKESLIEREEVACEQDTLPLRDDSKPTEPKYYPVTSLCNDYDECSLCPEDPKFCDLNEHVEKEEEESQDDYEAKIYADFVKHYEGYWINKHNKLIEEFLEKLKFVYNRICITGTYGSLRDLMKEYEERLK
jgi:hypothetical protein